MILGPVKKWAGEFRAPSDKSITHRAFMFASLASEDCVVVNPLRGEDCMATLDAMKSLGMSVSELNGEFRLSPISNWLTPPGPIDCGNSGTTMRLLAGLLSGRDLKVSLTGDASLSRRPMGRIAKPLREMGAEITGETAPITIRGGGLKGIQYRSPVASAQVKSCVLLAGLSAEGASSVTEPTLSRDHTERFLLAMGADLNSPVPTPYLAATEYDWALPHTVTLSPRSLLNGYRIEVPGDISSAAFFLCAAASKPGSEVTVTQLSVNPSRTGLLDVFSQMGVRFQLSNHKMEGGEPVASLTVTGPNELKPFSISESLVPRLIDEIPILAVLATQANGISVIRDAKELRVKESDRIETVSRFLREMGAKIETFEDGMAITGPTPLSPTAIEAHGDHRIAMAFAIAATLCPAGTQMTIGGAEAVRTSYPNFEEHLQRLSVV